MPQPSANLAARWTLGTFCLLLGCMGHGGSLATTHVDSDPNPERSRGAGGIFLSATEVKGPEHDRCFSSPPDNAAACKQAKRDAAIYAQKLAMSDSVCLENGVGEAKVSRDCHARAVVRDLGSNRILMEIRDATPESKYFKLIQHEIWFDESALIDTYLAERGF